MKNLVGGRTYYFRIFAHAGDNSEASEEVKFSVPARVKHKVNTHFNANIPCINVIVVLSNAWQTYFQAITAGVVGGFLFFVVAIILSVCAVKICNKRKRRKQEKGK